MTTAVFITNDKIQVAQGGMKGKTLAVKRLFQEPLEEGAMINGIITNDSDVKEAVKRMWKKYELPDKKITLIVQGRGVSTKLVNAPKLNENKMLAFVKGEFSGNENYQDMVFDYSVRERNGENGGAVVLACMAEPDFLRAYTDIFGSLGIKLEKIDTALNCQIKLSEKISEFGNKTFVICLADRNTVTMTLFVNGKYSFSNSSRLNAERNSPDLADNVGRLVSSIIQFNKSEKNGFDITDVYFGGFDDGEYQPLSVIGSAFGINAQKFTAGKAVRFEKGNNSAADCVCILGGLI